jgi:S-adenosylmethionine/arginine decarboxylase-like enzyme
MFMRLPVQAVIVAALAAGSAFADNGAKTFVVSGQPELRIETDDGHVTVHTWDEQRVAVRVTTAGWKIGPGEVEVGQS